MKISGGFGAPGFLSPKNHNLHTAKRAHRNPGIVVSGMTDARNVDNISQEGNSEATMQKADAIFPLSGPRPERFKVQPGETNNVRLSCSSEDNSIPSFVFTMVFHMY